MLVDLKIKVKLKYIVPKEKQLLINNFDSYGEMEVDVPVKDLKEKIGMTAQEYRKKEPLIQKRATQLELPFNYKYNQKSDKNHFDKVFDITQTAQFAL
jgi:hypothetical protein